MTQANVAEADFIFELFSIIKDFSQPLPSSNDDSRLYFCQHPVSFVRKLVNNNFDSSSSEPGAEYFFVLRARLSSTVQEACMILNQRKLVIIQITKYFSPKIFLIKTALSTESEINPLFTTK